MITRAIWWVISCVLLGSVVSVSAAQEEQSKKARISPSNAPSGAELFGKHCAACHGNDLKGSGPFPPPYRVPPDLTTLSRRHGGKFPDAYVSRVLRNGVTMAAHGPAEMPVWGTEFAAAGQLDKVQVTERIKNLADYIRSFQTK